MTWKGFKGNVKAWLTFTPSSRPRKVLKSKLISIKDHINKNPKLKRKLINLLDKMPSVKKRLQKVGGKVSSTAVDNLLTIGDLSPQAKEIHDRLTILPPKKNMDRDHTCV